MSEAPHVIVLGTGGAGFTAPIAAHEAGARVSLFEKGDQVGGTTAWSGGLICAAAGRRLSAACCAPASIAASSRKPAINAQVLSVEGRPIAGFYAAGNVMASVMGMTYGGLGGTIAPGMVLGYLAGRHAAGASERAN